MVEWLHAFRSVHGEPYVLALQTDEGALYIRVMANSEAHFRTSIDDAAEELRACRLRWDPKHWLTAVAGTRPQLDLTTSAWQPTYKRFVAEVRAAMIAAMVGAKAYRRRGISSTTMLFTCHVDGDGATVFDRESVRRLNPRRKAAALLDALERISPP